MRHTERDVLPRYTCILERIERHLGARLSNALHRDCAAHLAGVHDRLAGLDFGLTERLVEHQTCATELELLKHTPRRERRKGMLSKTCRSRNCIPWLGSHRHAQ